MTELPYWTKRWSCVGCGERFAMEPYDIGSGPEVSCPYCETCFGADGQPLQPLDLDRVQEMLDEAIAARGGRRTGRHRARPPQPQEQQEGRG